MRKYFLSLVLAFCSSHVFADISDANKTILVNGDQTKFAITLPSNPSTGFIWLIDSYNSQLLRLEKHDYIPSKDKHILGAPGVEQWVFDVKAKIVAPQMTKITLIQARPWDIKNSTAETKTFVVVLNG